MSLILRVNAGERTLESSGRPVPISPKALDVLLVLLENRGRVVEKDELMRRVWPGTFVEENSLAFNISVLRKVFAGYNASYLSTSRQYPGAATGSSPRRCRHLESPHPLRSPRKNPRCGGNWQVHSALWLSSSRC